MDYCQTCIYYPPSSCDGKPCTQCEPESQFQNCYVKKEADSKPTNADRIRSMTDEELANMWFSYVDCGECPMHRECNMLPQDCLRLALEWLKKEATDGS